MKKAGIFDALIGICDRLEEVFGYRIYTEHIEQGFVEPCFFVKNISSRQTRIGYRRYSRNQDFCIHYFPKEKGSIDECLKMADKLYFDLEYIKINNNLTRGTLMRHDILNGVLNFYANYNYHLIVEKDEPNMEYLKQRGGIKSER